MARKFQLEKLKIIYNYKTKKP